MEKLFQLALKSTAIFLFAVLAFAPAARGSITLDAASTATNGANNTSIAWSHTVGVGVDRMLVVGVTTESTPDRTVTSVTFGAQALTQVAGARAFNGTPANATDLWYLPAPAEVTDTITVTFSGSVSAGTVAGSVSLFGVVQGPPEAVANSSAGSTGSTNSASITTLTFGSWLVDAVNNSSANSTFTPTSGQTKRWGAGTSSHTGAGGTREVTPAGATTNTWTTPVTGRRALSVAAFAPVTPPPFEANMLTFGPGATITGTDIAWYVPFGSVLTSLAPTYTKSAGATCPKASGSPQDFSSGPVHYILTSADSLLVNDYTVTVTVFPDESTIIWNVGSGGWDFGTINWIGQVSSSPTIFYDGVNVLFNNTAGGTITVLPNVKPLSTTVDAASGIYTFSGGAIAGSGSLTKSGAGTLRLGTTNTYTGKTIVQGGTLATALGADYLSNAGVPGVFGAPTGLNATIDLYNEVVLQNNGSLPRLNQATDRPLNLAGTGPGTVSIRVNDNDTSFTFGAVTATGTGEKTLALFTGNNGNGDRESLIFTGAIADSSDSSPTSLQVTFGTQTASTSFVSLKGVNTFTGPITLTQGANDPTCTLAIGGVRTKDGNTPGSGKLGNGNYPGAISLGTKTILEYDSSAAQILAGPISGAGVVTKTGSGLLTLSGTNTYSGTNTVSAGTLKVVHAVSLGTNTLAIAAGAKVQLDYSGTRTIGALTIENVPKDNGIYGSSASGAPLANQDDLHFAGPGTVTVGLITPPPTITAFGISGTDFSITFDTLVDSCYRVEYTDSLPPLWQEVVGSKQGTGNPESLVDIDATGVSPQRFYRVVQVPGLCQ